MHIWLAWLSLWQELNPGHPTTNHPCSSCCRFVDPQSQCHALVQDRAVPEIGDVPEGTGFIWKYPSSVMFPRYVRYLQSNYHRRAWNWVQRGLFTGHLVFGMIRFWHCAVHAWDVDISMFCLLAKWLGLLKVMCRPKWMPWIPLFCVLLMLIV